MLGGIMEKKNKGLARKEKIKEGEQFITIKTIQITATRPTACNNQRQNVLGNK